MNFPFGAVIYAVHPQTIEQSFETSNNPDPGHR